MCVVILLSSVDRLTPAGEELLKRAPALIDEFEEMLSAIDDRAKGYSGVTRVSAPVTFGEAYVAAMLARFQANHPNVTFELNLSDTFEDLASSGTDVAFALGSAR